MYIVISPVLKEWEILEETYYLLLILLFNTLKDFLILFSADSRKVTFLSALNCSESLSIIYKCQFSKRITLFELDYFDKPGIFSLLNLLIKLQQLLLI